jgi:hypothetical protein
LIGDGAMGRVTLGGATVEGASAGAKGEADGMGGAYAADGVTASCVGAEDSTASTMTRRVMTALSSVWVVAVRWSAGGVAVPAEGAGGTATGEEEGRDGRVASGARLVEGLGDATIELWDQEVAEKTGPVEGRGRVVAEGWRVGGADPEVAGRVEATEGVGPGERVAGGTGGGAGGSGPRVLAAR